MIRFFLLTLAVLVILSMAGYAAFLFYKLHKQKNQLEQARNARFHNVIDSIDVIARAMLAQQCDLSEGVLRLKPLLDVLGLKLARFSAMWALYETVENMPILDERKTLKRNERMKLDLEREAKEAHLAQHIELELRQLLTEITQLKQQLK